jgi:predicted Zn-dependent protease
MKYSNPKIPEGINSTDENPVKEFALLASGIIVVVVVLIFMLSALLDWGSKFLPFSYEQQVATPIVNEYLSEFPNESNTVVLYLQKLVDNITPLMTLDDDMTIRVHYVNQDTINGMATLGGNIFIFRGLLEKLPNENALVMLLAHEIAHVKLRHPVKALSKGVLISLMLAIVSGQSNSDMSGLLSGTSQLAFLGFSRTQEQAADAQATLLNQRYYQHTQGAIELFDVLLAESEAASMTSLALFNSHPDIGARIDTVIKTSQANQWQQSGILIEIPAEIKQQLAVDRLEHEQLVAEDR